MTMTTEVTTSSFAIFNRKNKLIDKSRSLKLICDHLGLSYHNVVTAIRVDGVFINADIIIQRQDEYDLYNSFVNAGLAVAELEDHGKWRQPHDKKKCNSKEDRALIKARELAGLL